MGQTIKLNESQLRDIVSESIKAALNETFQYVINSFQQTMIDRAIKENTPYDANAIYNLANKIYKESFSQYNYNELMDDWKMCGGFKAVANRIKLNQQGKQYVQPSPMGNLGTKQMNYPTQYLPSNR